MKSIYGGEIEVVITGAGRADYVNGNEIYEVKPNSQYNDQSGKEQLSNYVEHSRGSQKGTSLLSRIPEDIHIENLEIINTRSLKISCDVACITNSLDPKQAGMVYYIPYNWKVQQDSTLPTTLMITGIILSSILKEGTATVAAAATTFAEDAAAACFIFLVPTQVLQMQQNKTNPPDQI